MFLNNFDYQHFLSTYKNNPTELLNMIFENEAASPYEVVTNHIICNANLLTLDYIHEIKTIKYFSPKLEILEASSNGKMSRLGEKFIHRFDNRIESIETDKIENYKNSNTLYSDYNSYINKHGKLFTRKYYALKKIPTNGQLIKDEFLTFDDKEYDKCNDRSKHIVYSTVSYRINNGNILKYSLNQLEDNSFLLKLKLDPNYSNDYYAYEIIHRGALFDYPKFLSTDIEVYLSSKYVLSKIIAYDKYIAKSGIISVNIDTKSILNYYHSNNHIFDINGKNIKVDIDENKLEKKFTLFNIIK